MGRRSNAKERLIDAARELMYVRGYTAVGVQEICARAGVNKGSFYHFFPSKQALALAVIEAHIQQVQKGWQEAMSVPCPLLERIQGVFQAAYKTHCLLFEHHEGHMLGCPLGNLALELSTQDDCIRQKLREAFGIWTQMLEHALSEATAQGDLPALPVSTTAQALIAYFQGVVLLAKTENDPTVLKQLAPGAVHLVEAATRMP